MVGILDELQPTRTQFSLIQQFLDGQPKKEREEWLEALRRADLYSSHSIIELMKKNGLDGVNENGIIRFRRKLEGYVSAR